MDSREKPRLMLIRGGGEASRTTSRSFVSLDTASPAESPAVQLELDSAAAQRRRIVSLGLDGLYFHEFYQILKIAGIRRIVDTRILAAFLGSGFRPHLVGEVFEELQIEYERIQDLQNPFQVGASARTPAEALDLYSSHLRECREILLGLSRRASRGPVLLLGRTAEHVGSERERIIAELARIGEPLELLIVRKLESSIRVTPSLLPGERPEPTTCEPTAAERKATKKCGPSKRGKLSRSKREEAQIALPFAGSPTLKSK